MKTGSTVDGVCAVLQGYLLGLNVAGLPQIRSAQDHPLDQLPSGVAAMCYWGGGPFNSTSLSMRATGDLIVEISVPRADLPHDIAQLQPYIEPIVNLLFSKFLNDSHWQQSVDAIGDIEVSAPHAEQYGPDVIRMVIRFTVKKVSMFSAIT